MSEFFKTFRLVSRQVWRDAAEYTIRAHNFSEFLTAWLMLLFFALVIGPILFCLALLLFPLSFLVLLFRKEPERQPVKVSNYKLKKQFRDEDAND